MLQEQVEEVVQGLEEVVAKELVVENLYEPPPAQPVFFWLFCGICCLIF